MDVDNKLRQANKFGMANRAKVKALIRGINPQALAVMDLIDRELNDWGILRFVTLTEDMAREEQIMALIEKYLKKGDTLAAATRKARERSGSSGIILARRSPQSILQLYTSGEMSGGTFHS